MEITNFEPVTVSPTNISINDGLWATVGYAGLWFWGTIKVDVTVRGKTTPGVIQAGVAKNKFTVSKTVYGIGEGQKDITILMYDLVTHQVPGLVVGDSVTVTCGEFSYDYEVIQIATRR